MSEVYCGDAQPGSDAHIELLPGCRIGLRLHEMLRDWTWSLVTRNVAAAVIVRRE